MKSYRPSTLQDELNRARYLQDANPRTSFPSRLNVISQLKNQIPPPMKIPSGNFKRDNFSRDRDELRRIKLCLTYQEPWVPRHKCAKGKDHYIDIFSNSEAEEKEEGSDISAEGANEIVEKEPPP